MEYRSTLNHFTSRNRVAYVFLIMLVLFTQCHHNPDKIIIKRIPYGADGMMEEFQLTKDSVKNGYDKVFYADGKLMSEEYYVAGKLTGPRKQYNNNGEIAQLLIPIGDSSQGYFVHWDSIGYLDRKGHYKNNKLYGPIYDYFQSGKVSRYLQYDDSNKLVYKRVYDENGNTVKISGDEFFNYHLPQDSDYKLGDTLKVEMSGVSPYKCDCMLYFKEDDKFLVSRDLSPQEESCELIYPCTKLGRHKIWVKLLMHDSIKEDYMEYHLMSLINSRRIDNNRGINGSATTIAYFY